MLQRERRIRDEERMHEVREVGMASELMQNGVQPLRIPLVREDREEEQRRGNRVEDAGRAQLMGRVDGLERRVAVHVEQLVIEGQQPGK